MANARITCITKPHNGSHEHITHVGNPTAGWKLTTADAVHRIDNKIDTFYVQDAQGRVANVGVVRTQGHAPYLRTYADKVWTDNLLALPQC